MRATYGNYELILGLPFSIGSERFTMGDPKAKEGKGARLSEEDCLKALNILAKRQTQDPEGLKLFARMLYIAFTKGVVLKASVEFGSKVTLYLSRQKMDRPNGQLLVAGARDQFVRLFGELTGQDLHVVWFDGGMPPRRSGKRGSSGALGVLLDAIDGAAEALKLAAAIDILFGDD